MHTRKYPTIIPCLTVIDTQKTIDFYKNAFGFTHANPTEEYVEMRYKDVVIMFGPEGEYEKPTKAPKNSGEPCPITLYIYCDDVDTFYTNALKHGAKSVSSPTTMEWNDRMCSLEDIDGYSWSFAQRK